MISLSSGMTIVNTYTPTKAFASRLTIVGHEPEAKRK